MGFARVQKESRTDDVSNARQRVTKARSSNVTVRIKPGGGGATSVFVLTSPWATVFRPALTTLLPSTCSRPSHAGSGSNIERTNRLLSYAQLFTYVDGLDFLSRVSCGQNLVMNQRTNCWSSLASILHRSITTSLARLHNRQPDAGYAVA